MRARVDPALLAFAIAPLFLACATPLPQPVGAPGEREQYRHCGWQTYAVSARHLSRVRGVVALAGIDPLPGVTILLENTDAPTIGYLATSDAEGRFDFGNIPPGRYRLNTCLSGFNTIEMPVLVTPSGSARPLRLSLALSA